ncbi:ATP-binding protein [Anabaena sp. UHCC 0399]|uniref:ATP-binding protein n=1 Tax=Anabaena sp. UHCC 0399 TaxID=3110238 RepID=UPI002B1F4741|nr:ATP-binding protein [Anabaena sp. UHCC 0399]MEA5565304.1 ATP-binding protein [Anabaena sp. UHCC 0399]
MPSKPVADDWYPANHRYLMGVIAQTRQVLERLIEQQEQGNEDWKTGIFVDIEKEPAFAQAPPALEQLCQIFNLSPLERQIVMLCAGMEFDRNWGRLCAKAQGQPQWEYPTFSLALSITSSPYWGALTQDAPLRRWRLIEMGSAPALTISPLRLDEQITHYLAGLRPLDERLAQLGASPLQMENLVPSHTALAEQMANSWVQASQEQRVLPILQLCGTDATSKKAIAAHTCQILGLTGYAVTAQNLPRENHQLHLVRCLWEREWRLYRRVMVLDGGNTTESSEGERENNITQLLDTLDAPLIISSLERRRAIQRPLLTLDVHQPSPAEQRQVWQTALSETSSDWNGHIDRLVSHFNLNTATITATSWQFKTQHNPADDTAQAFRSLWDACRSQARPRLDELAQRIEATAQWEDLVLPPNELGVLKDIAAHLRQRSKVYEQWGFAAKGGRGLGISAMFAGASGTGKTLAAEVLANTLHLDVYRIDLSAVVSKYIGETEKNLRRVFDAAEGGGVILLFDEADALFGKRTEVKDSHDRHANIEVSYLLQRMESYRGLAILTTNLKASLDQAFLRRIRFIVQFPFPDAKQRAEIWRRVFPSQTPTADLDFEKLAKLSVAGGNIRNIALNAAFVAADADEPVGMKHILQSAKSEYIKMERPLTDVEVKGWIS